MPNTNALFTASSGGAIPDYATNSNSNPGTAGLVPASLQGYDQMQKVLRAGYGWTAQHRSASVADVNPSGNVLFDNVESIVFNQQTAGIVAELEAPFDVNDHRVLTLVPGPGMLVPLTVTGDAAGSDSVVLTVGGPVQQLMWDGTKWRKLAPEASTLAYVQSVATAAQTTGLTVGSPVTFGPAATSGGISIAATGVITLQGGQRYRLIGQPNRVDLANANSWGVFQWRDITNNALIGNAIEFDPFTSPANAASGSAAIAVIEPVTTITVRLEITQNVGLTGIGHASAGFPKASCLIEQLPTTQVVDPGTVPVETLTHVFATNTLTGQALPANGAGMPFNSVLSGTIPHASGVFTLAAGTTYELRGNLGQVAWGGGTIQNVNFQWRDITGNALLGVAGEIFSVTTTGVNQNTTQDAVAIFTPSVTSTVRLEITGQNGTSITYGTSLGRQPHAVIKAMPTATVIDTGSVAVNDQAASGYFDIGAMRIQWINTALSSSGNISLPAPFANTNYVVQGNSSTGNAQMVNGLPVSTTAFNGYIYNHDGNHPGTPTPVSFLLIGQKP